MTGIIAQARTPWQGDLLDSSELNAIARILEAGKGELHKKARLAFPASPNFWILRILPENPLENRWNLWYFDTSESKARWNFQKRVAARSLRDRLPVPL